MRKRSTSVWRSLRTPLVLMVTLELILGVGWLDLAETDRATLRRLITPERFALLGLIAIPAWIAWIGQRYLQFERERLSLNHATEVILSMTHGEATHRINSRIVPTRWFKLVTAINALGEETIRLRASLQQARDEARASADADNARLAGLLANLELAVVVFRTDGLIVLYNRASAKLFHRQQPSLGLARSIFLFFDQKLIEHSIKALQKPQTDNPNKPIQVLTTSLDGRRMRLQLSGLRALNTKGEHSNAVVLMATDVTQQLQDDANSVALFQTLLEQARSSLPRQEPDSLRLFDKFDAVNQDITRRLHRNWPLEHVRAADLRLLACRHIADLTGLRAVDAGGDEDLWLIIDSFTLLQTIANLAERLQEAFAITTLRISVVSHNAGAVLDLSWLGPPMSAETAFAWQTDAFTLGGEDSALSLVQVMERHGGRAWYERHAPTQSNLFRLLLEKTISDEDVSSISPWPTHYDFALLNAQTASQRLDHLTLTVFDTETTGLQAGSDEIVWLSAFRIVNGRLLEDEVFDTLVDPQRPIPSTATQIHGVRESQVRGKPTITEVLPQFWRFASDSVLLGHNLDFDLRFFAVKEARAGVRFTQPHLDTLKLAEVVFPSEASNSLQELAARLGLPEGQLHHANDDARITGMIFLAMLPLLAARGVFTLDQAIKASSQTRYARLTYN